MAAYVKIPKKDLKSFIEEYDIGVVINCEGIEEGIENSNYFLQTSLGNFILTLYGKRVNPNDLPFFIELMKHLAHLGLHCPTPLVGRDGISLRKLCNHQATITSFLEGEWPRHITTHHCATIGKAIANIHIKGLSFPQSRTNSLGFNFWRQLFEQEYNQINEIKSSLSDLINHELNYLEHNWPKDLPIGIIHADLFPDNVLYQNDKISGIIDFYFACTDFLAYDIAICFNAWCFEHDDTFNINKASLLLSNYQQIRKLSVPEFNALPILARGASIRFLLTRLYDYFNTPTDAFVKQKDPLEYERKLRFHAKINVANDYVF
ncbi:MAG: homoserine kinase [Rhodospirillaceae bacterium]|jgi:homoserine kinase type II|nr:homoserine kinase [Rhodospirillaceae bacterium]